MTRTVLCADTTLLPVALFMTSPGKVSVPTGVVLVEVEVAVVPPELPAAAVVPPTAVVPPLELVPPLGPVPPAALELGGVVEPALALLVTSPVEPPTADEPPELEPATALLLEELLPAEGVTFPPLEEEEEEEELLLLEEPPPPPAELLLDVEELPPVDVPEPVLPPPLSVLSAE